MTTGGWTLEDKLRALRTAVEKKQQDRARAELALEAARGREAAALEALQAEFGVTSLEAAGELLASLETDLEQACAVAEAALTEAEK